MARRRRAARSRAYSCAWLVAALVLGAREHEADATAAARDCSRPLPASAHRPTREVVATTFTKIDGEVWRDWDWRSITTVIDVFRSTNESALACLAHKHGARLLLNLGDREMVESFQFNRSRDLLNLSAIDAVAAGVAAVGADGISIDVESNVAQDQAAAREAFTSFVVRLRAALLRNNPGSVLIFCSTAYPNRADANKGSWPHFNLPAIANATDWFYVMAYGANHWADNQTAIANSPLSLSSGAILGFAAIGVPASHLVLGLPWYGYDNTCVAGTRPDAKVCVRGKSGHELGKAAFFQELPLLYDQRHRNACGGPSGRKCGPESFDPAVHTILGLLLHNRTSPVWWDDSPTVQSAYFNYVDDQSVTHQVWFDNARSLQMRCALARKAGLRGVGSWRSDMVDYGSAVTTGCSRELFAVMAGNTSRSSTKLESMTRRRHSSSCPLSAVGMDDGTPSPQWNRNLKTEDGYASTAPYRTVICVDTYNSARSLQTRCPPAL